jgi:hypothetical protein
VSPSLPLYAVLDRSATGKPRVVTVDLGSCGELRSEVAGRAGRGLARGAHVILLVKVWEG